MNTGILIFAIMACVVAIIALGYPRHHCVKCGKACDGRMAGGTVDDPICVRCVDGR